MSGTPTKDLGPDELLEMLSLMEKLKTPAPRVEVKEPVVEVLSLDRLKGELDSVGGKGALTRAVRGGRRKAHWKERKRKQRERMRPYMAQKYKEATMPRRKRLAEEGKWWDYYLMEWKKRGYKVEATEEQWLEYVQPTFTEQSVPVVFRFNTAKPIRLENLMIRDTETKTVLFDGQDWMLRQLGAIE